MGVKEFPSILPVGRQVLQILDDKEKISAETLLLFFSAVKKPYAFHLYTYTLLPPADFVSL